MDDVKYGEILLPGDEETQSRREKTVRKKFWPTFKRAVRQIPFSRDVVAAFYCALDPQTRWGMQGLLIDISRKEDNTILFVTHDVAEAVYLADNVFVLSKRPAQVVQRIDVPVFHDRDLALKSSNEFRDVEKQLLDLLYRRDA